jgi:hypothetical protein
MLSMIANPVTALPVGYPRSGLSRSDLVPWPFSSVSAAHHFGSDRRHSGHWLACCWLDPVASDPFQTWDVQCNRLSDLRNGWRAR